MRKEILKLMIDNEMDNKKFAQAIGKSEGYVSMFLKGKRDCTIKTGKEIAKLFNVKLDDIF